jgi:lipoprotein NlpD
MVARPAPVMARSIGWLGLALLLGGCVAQPGLPPVVDRTGGVVTAPPRPSAPAGLPPGQPLGTASWETDSPEFHEVQPGDTLYGIAWRHGIDYRIIAQANGIEPPYRIVVGQRLRLGGPAQPPLSPVIAQVPDGRTQAAPRYEPEPPVSRGFEFVPDASMASEEHWQDLPPPGPMPMEPSDAPAAAVPRPLPIEMPPTSRPLPTPIEQPPEPVVVVPAVPAERTATVAEPPAAPLPAPPVAAAPVEPERAVPAPAAPPVPAAAAGTAGWRWPTSGAVQKGFGNGNRGIDFRLDANEPVLAAGGGEVVYAGNGLGGFRYLVIVKHDQRFLSAYSLNRNIAVQEGQQISSGGVIAQSDANGGAAGTLRFEIRRDGQPVDPVGIIGRR